MHFAYTDPLPDAHAALIAAPIIHLAAVGLLFAVAALAAAFLPARGAAPVEAPAPAASVEAEAVGPIYCPRSRRWRDAKTGRLVKAPSV